MQRKARLTINAREAVELIRSGMTDEDLMKRYDISARSLERLFRKLTDAGEIRRFELDRRMLKSSRSHVVGVVSRGATETRSRKKKVQINAEEVVGSIRGRLSDLELMEKYNLSAHGLNRLFRKLVERGDLDQSELSERQHAFRWGEVAFLRSEGDVPEPVDDLEDEVITWRTRFREFVEERKVIIAALLGALGGMVFTLVTLTMIIGPGRTMEILGYRSGIADPVLMSQDPIAVLADQFIAILESIAKGAPEATGSQAGESASRYDQCLRNCDREHAGGDDAEQVLRLNCRKNCVLMYSERMKRIRELYHGSSPGR